MQKEIKFLKFYADWCSPCKFYERTINKVRGSDNFPQVQFIEYNADFDFDICQQYSVASLPTTIILVDGEIKFNESGALTEQKLIDTLNEIIEAK